MGNKLKQLIENSLNKESQGKKLKQQSIENYITEILNMDVIDSENLGNSGSLKDIIKIIAKPKHLDSKYTFISNHYDYEHRELTSRQDSIILIKIEGTEGIHKVEKIFYFNSHSDESNRKHKLLNTPLDKLISGESEDEELNFVVNLLKQKLKDKKGYSYTEEQKGNLYDFLINLNDEIKIQTGMSNTIQVSFKNKKFQTMQIIYRNVSKEKLTKEVEQLSSFITNYFDWNITVDDHNISKLYDFLQSKKMIQDVITSSIIKNESLYLAQLFQDIIIGDWDTYKQVNLSIKYNYKAKQFELTASYLFNEVNLFCHSIEEVKNTIEEIESLLS